MYHAGGIIELQEARRQKVFGIGVGVALFDTGIAREHPDLQRRGKIVAFKDFTGKEVSCYDNNGHGTHVAGILGGDGTASGGRYMGVAPGCHFVVVKILDHEGNGEVQSVLNGIQWVLLNREKYNIRVVNISIGTAGTVDMGEDSLLVRAVDELWDAGLVVCVAAGNNGPKKGSIGAPGNSRKVITVGAFDDRKISGKRKGIQYYSGRGPTEECVCKPDIIAPGSEIISCNYRPEYINFSRRNAYYTTKSGTSMATPMVSGAVCLALEKNPLLTNKEIKILVKECAVDRGESHNIQGWGMLNVRRLLRLI